LILAAEKLFTKLQTRLEKTRCPDLCLQQIEECFVICNSAILMLCKGIKKKGFTCAEQEILFFKSVKPRFVSLQRYYVLLYNHIMFLPEDHQERFKYLERSLQKLERMLAEHDEFYSYFQSGLSHLDHEYFTRPEHSLESTPGEILISEIIAHYEMADYIKKEIGKLQAGQC
jgi:hypothetical protein